MPKQFSFTCYSFYVMRQEHFGILLVPDLEAYVFAKESPATRAREGKPFGGVVWDGMNNEKTNARKLWNGVLLHKCWKNAAAGFRIIKGIGFVVGWRPIGPHSLLKRGVQLIRVRFSCETDDSAGRKQASLELTRLVFIGPAFSVFGDFDAKSKLSKHPTCAI